MTASGPFAMGPSMTGNNARRSVPRSNFAPVMSSSSGSSNLGAGLTRTTAPSLKMEDGKGKQKAVDDDEQYSDPDEGVEIIDMENIRQMDWMAPESLRKQRHQAKMKKEEPAEGLPGMWNSSPLISRTD